MSRKSMPKQLLRFISRPGHPEPRSLLEISADRLEGLVPAERRTICTNEGFRGLIRERLPVFSDEQILGEPTGRDTVNAVGFAAAVLEKQDPDAVFAVLTADHLIEPEDEFRRLMDVGFRLVEEDENRLVTFSIKPTYAATGFGYVERGRAIEGTDGLAFDVTRFVEKPDEHRAQAYLESGVFSWNSGMFVWKASTFLRCLERFKPESYAGLRKIQDAWGTPTQQSVLEQVYPTLPKISVDFAVMEPASKDDQVSVATVIMDLDWLDVGSWPAFANTIDGDAAGNRVSGFGDGAGEAIIEDGNRNLVVTSDSSHTVALLGCEDMIVVHTPDATLVMPAAKAEALKSVHARASDTLK